MQGISAKEHQLLVVAFQRFEQMAVIAKGKISIEEDSKTREGMAELRTMYIRFQTLMSELDQCAKHYELQRKSVKSILNKSLRKMNPEIKRRRKYL